MQRLHVFKTFAESFFFLPFGLFVLISQLRQLLQKQGKGMFVGQFSQVQ